MSGMTGFISSQTLPEAATVLEAVSRAIAHRGDPACRHLHQQRCAVATRHWAGAGYSTSLFVDPEGLAAVDGLLVNLPALAREVAAAGAPPPEQPAEILWHLLRRYGPRVLERLDGQFALVICHFRDNRVLLARDRFGLRPLVYVSRAGGLWWGSEAKAMFADPRVERRINAAVIPSAVSTGVMLAPETVFQDVLRVPPGHYLQGTAGQELELVRYDNPVRPETLEISEAEADRRLLELLDASVRRQLAACPRQAVLLSSGVDSALLADRLAEATGGGALAVSVGAPDWPGDETGAAEDVARACGMPFRRLWVDTSEELLGHFRRLVWLLEQPTRFDNSWALQAALAGAPDLPAGLSTGEGADTIVGSAALLKYHRWQRIRALPRPARRALGAMRPLLLHVPGIRQWADVMGYEDMQQMLRDGVALPLDPDGRDYHPTIPDHLRRLGEYLSGWSADQARQVLCLAGYTTPWLERMEAVIAGAGREMFTPFVTSAMFDFSLALPLRMKADPRASKPCARRLAARRFGRAMAYRRKLPLSSPTARWLCQSAPVAAAVAALGRSDHPIRQFIPGDTVEGYVRRVQASNAQDDQARWAVCRLLSLALWLEVFQFEI